MGSCVSWFADFKNSLVQMFAQSSLTPVEMVAKLEALVSRISRDLA